MSSRTLPIAAAVFFAIFMLTVLLSGSSTLLVPVVILALIVGLGAGAFAALSRSKAKRAGDSASDSSDPVPGTAFSTDDETPLGDTPEAHDEISPHDLPMGHPGRTAAARMAAGSADRTTRGGARVVAEPPAPRS